MYFSSSGAWVPDDDPEYPNFAIPYCDEDWSVDSVQAPHTPLTHWNPNITDITREIAQLNRFHEGQSSYQRFLQDKNYEKALAPSGFNVWEGNKKCKFTFKDGKVKAGCSAADFMKAGLSRFLMKDAWK